MDAIYETQSFLWRTQLTLAKWTRSFGLMEWRAIGALLLSYEVVRQAERAAGLVENLGGFI